MSMGNCVVGNDLTVILASIDRLVLFFWLGNLFGFYLGGVLMARADVCTDMGAGYFFHVKLLKLLFH